MVVMVDVVVVVRSAVTLRVSLCFLAICQATESGIGARAWCQIQLRVGWVPVLQKERRLVVNLRQSPGDEAMG